MATPREQIEQAQRVIENARDGKAHRAARAVLRRMDRPEEAEAVRDMKNQHRYDENDKLRDNDPVGGKHQEKQEFDKALKDATQNDSFMIAVAANPYLMRQLENMDRKERLKMLQEIGQEGATVSVANGKITVTQTDGTRTVRDLPAADRAELRTDTDTIQQAVSGASLADVLTTVGQNLPRTDTRSSSYYGARFDRPFHGRHWAPVRENGWLMQRLQTALAENGRFLNDVIENPDMVKSLHKISQTEHGKAAVQRALDHVAENDGHTMTIEDDWIFIIDASGNVVSRIYTQDTSELSADAQLGLAIQGATDLQKSIHDAANKIRSYYGEDSEEAENHIIVQLSDAIRNGGGNLDAIEGLSDEQKKSLARMMQEPAGRALLSSIVEYYGDNPDKDPERFIRVISGQATSADFLYFISPEGRREIGDIVMELGEEGKEALNQYIDGLDLPENEKAHLRALINGGMNIGLVGLEGIGVMVDIFLQILELMGMDPEAAAGFEFDLKGSGRHIGRSADPTGLTEEPTKHPRPEEEPVAGAGGPSAPAAPPAA